jgi:hypothetical protein
MQRFISFHAGGAGPREVHVEGGWRANLALHLGMFVRGVVIRGQMQLFVGRREIVNQAQEAKPLLVAVPLHAAAGAGR